MKKKKRKKSIILYYIYYILYIIYSVILVLQRPQTVLYKGEVKVDLSQTTKTRLFSEEDSSFSPKE
jgi:hypothetical protein